MTPGKVWIPAAGLRVGDTLHGRGGAFDVVAVTANGPGFKVAASGRGMAWRLWVGGKERVLVSTRSVT